MTLSLLRQFLLTVCVVLLAGLLGSGQIEAGDFDGTWTASLELTSGVGDCEGYVLGKVRITNDKISGIVNHSKGGDFSLSGSIAPDGKFQNVGASGTVEVAFTGTLSGNSGAGDWVEGRRGCRGTWSLKKRLR